MLATKEKGIKSSPHQLPSYALLKPKTILIVDDDPAIRNLLKVILRRANLTCLDAADGKEALHILSQYKVDLALIDLNMPKVNGFQLINIMRQNEEYDRIPLIVVTADSHKESVVKSLKAGAQDYIVKPIKNDLLIQKINEHMDISLG